MTEVVASELGRAERYDILSEKFRALFEKLARPNGYLSQLGTKDCAEGARAMFYYLRMEEAVCHLLTRNAEATQEAIRIYKQVLAEFPKSASGHFRLGQAYSRLAEANSAIASYEAAKSALQVTDHTTLIDRMINVPEPQRRYILESLPRLLGVQYFNKARSKASEGAHEESLLFYSKAFSETATKISSTPNPSEYLAINNALFYAVEMLECGHSTGLSVDASVASRARQLLSSLEGCEIKDERHQPYILDTLVKCYGLPGLKNSGKAKAYSRKLLDRLAAEKVDEFDRDPYSQAARQEMFARAWQVLQSQPSKPKGRRANG